jgi:hypothetical protein
MRQHRTRNLDIPGSALTGCPGMTVIMTQLVGWVELFAKPTDAAAMGFAIRSDMRPI